MKAVLNETKRILAVMLSVAMIIAAVPQAAFAAPSDNETGEPELETAVQEEDIVSSDSQDGNADEIPVGSEEGNASDDKQDSKADVDVWFVKNEQATSNVILYPDGIGSSYTAPYYDSEHSAWVYGDSILDPNKDLYNANEVTVTDKGGDASAKVKGALVGTTDYTPGAITADGVNDTRVMAADHTNDFVFYMEPAVGYTWKPQTETKNAADYVKEKISAVYTDYTGYDHDAVLHYDEVETKSADKTKNEITVEEMSSWKNGLMKVTISKAVLDRVIKASLAKDKDSSGKDQYRKAVLAVKIPDFDVRAYKELPNITFVGGEGDNPLSSKKTFQWTGSGLSETATTPANTTDTTDTAWISLDAKKTVTGKTLENTMFSITYTPADGSKTTVYSVGTANSQMNADPGNDDEDSRGEIGGAYDDATGKFSISAPLMNAFIAGYGDLAVTIDTSEQLSRVYSVTKDYKSAYVTLTKDGKEELDNTIDASEDEYEFQVAAKNKTYGTRTIDNIRITTNTEGKVIFDKKKGIGSGVTCTKTTGKEIYTVNLDGTALADINDAITIKVTSYENIVTASLEDVVLYNAEGKALTNSDLISGEELKFEARPAAGKELESITYYFSNLPKTAVKPNGPDAKGLYSIPTVTDTVTVVAKAKTTAIGYTATLTQVKSGDSGDTAAGTAKVYNGNQVAHVADAEIAVGNSSPAGSVGSEQPYFFTVAAQQVSGTNYEVKSVQYRVGNTEDTASSLTNATLVSKFTATDSLTYEVYKTAPVNNNVFIYVTTSKRTVVHAPENEKVTVNFAEPGKTTNVARANDFYFTITTPSNVEVKRVTVDKTSYNVKPKDDADKPDLAPDLQPTDDGSYKLANSMLSTAGNDVYIEVITEETMPATAYTVKWSLDSENKKTKNPVLTQTPGSQSLNLVVGETTAVNANGSATHGYLEAEFSKTNIAKDTIGTVDGVATKTISTINTPTEGEAGFYAASYKSAVRTTGKTYDQNASTKAGEDVVIMDPDSSAGAVIVEATKAGTDKITAILKDTEVKHNTPVYKAELPVNVSAPYTNVRVIATNYDVDDSGAEPYVYDPDDITEIEAINVTDGDEDGTVPGCYYDDESPEGWHWDYSKGEVAVFTLVGLNTRTGKDEVLKNGKKGVTITGWRFEPDSNRDPVKTKKMFMGNAASVQTNDPADPNYYNRSGGTQVWIDNDDDATRSDILVAGIKAQQNVKVAVNVKQAGEEDGTDIVSAPINIVESGTYGLYPKYEITTGAKEEGWDAGGEYLLEKDGSMKSAKVSADLYDLGEDGGWGDLEDAESLATAINTGTISKYTGTVKYVTTLKNNTAPNGSEYLKLEGSNGNYTVTVNNAPKNDVAKVTLVVTAVIDGINVDWFRTVFYVYDSLPKGTVYLKLNDLQTKKDGEAVQQVLKDTYIANRETSIVETNHNGVDVADANEGIEFTKLTIGSNFVLPTQGDFQTAVDKDRTLLAWKVQDGSDYDYYYPGETIQVKSSMTFEPVWEDKYQWAKEGTATGIEGKGLAIYNGNLPWTTKAGVTYGYETFASGTDVTTPVLTAGVVNKGGSVPVVLWFEENATLTEALKNEAGGLEGTDDEALFAAVQKSRFVSQANGDTLVFTPYESVDWTSVVEAKNGAIKAIKETGVDQKVVVSWTSSGGKEYSTIPLAVKVAGAPGYTVKLDETEKDFFVDQANAYVGADILSSGMDISNVVDVFEGTGADFLAYWNGFYGVNNTAAQLTIAGTPEEQLVAFAIKTGSDFDKTAGGYGTIVEDGNGKLGMFAVIPGTKINYPTNATKNKDVVMQFMTKAQFLAEMGDSPNYTGMTAQPYTFDGNLDGITSNEQLIAKSTILGSECTFNMNGTEDEDGNKAEVTEPAGTFIGNGSHDLFKWTWTSSDTSVAEVEDSNFGEDGDYSDTGYGALTLKKAGTATISLVVTDASGIVAKKADLPITVTASDLVVSLLDPDKKPATRIYAEAKAAADDTTNTGYSLSFSTKEGLSITSITNAIDADEVFVTADGSRIDPANNKIYITTKDQSGWSTNPDLAGLQGLSDDGWVVLGYSYNDIDFEKKIPVSTYYTATLTEVGLASGVPEKTTLLNKGTAVGKMEDEDTEIEVKVTTANQQRTGSGTSTNPYILTYKNISLADYTATYTDDDDPHDFIGWSANGKTDDDPIYKSADGIASLKASDINSSAFTLLPVFTEQKLTKATLTKNTITLTNEREKGKTTPGTDNDSAAIEITVEPYASKAAIKLVPDKIGFYGMVTSAEADARTTLFGGEYMPLLSTHGTIEPAKRTQTRKFYVGAAASGDITSTEAQIGTADKRLAGTTLVKVMNGDNVLGTFTLNVNGYDTEEEKYYEDGAFVTNDSRKVIGETWFFGPDGKRIKKDGMLELADGSRILILSGKVASEGKHDYTDKDGVTGTYFVDKNGKVLTGWITKAGAVTTDSAQGVYYADPAAKGALIISKIAKVGENSYYFNGNGEKEVAPATANEYAATSDGKYYVNKDGNVAIGNIFKVEGKDRLFREDGTIVVHTDKDVVNGKITVNKIGYVIADDDTAKRDDILYNPVVKWTPSKFDSKWKKTDALPKFTYTVTVTSKNTGKEQTTDGTAVEAKVVKTTSENGVEKITLAVEANLAGYFVDAEGKTPATVENTKDAKLEATYDFKNGSEEGKKEGDVSEDGEAESEPEVTENTTTWNLFYTTEPLKVEVPEGAKHNSSTGYVEGTGKWTTYFGIGPDGTVHYSGAAKDRKKAANAGNSLIVIPLYGTDDSGAEVQTGEFEYQLPVYYQKPSLKLTSTTGTVKVNGGDQTLKTQVTQKKSNGAYEPLNVDAEGAVKLENWKNTQPTFEVDESVITFTATAKGNGNVAVQLPTWSDKISLKYTVKESKKNVLTGSTKQLVFNLNDVTNTAEQEFTLFYNSGDLNSGDPVTVTLPNKWADAKIEGIEAGELSAQTMTLKFADGATPKKGTYSVKFSTKDKAAFTLKVVVSNADVKKNAISLKYQSKIDLTTGQKGVVIPTLKGVNGPIEDVALDDASAAKFEVEYNEATNQIIVTPVEGQVTVGKNGNVTFKITAGGVPCETTIKNFQVAGKMPAVKVSSVKLPKTKVIAGTATGESNVLCTYKQGGKTFSTTPIEFSVNGGTKTTSEDTVVGEGWWKVDKANVYVQYDAETGRMHVHSIANAKGKGGTVKCEFKFAGQTKVKKANFKVAIDSNK